VTINDFASHCAEGILRGVFQNFNPVCGRNPIETDLDQIINHKSNTLRFMCLPLEEQNLCSRNLSDHEQSKAAMPLLSPHEQNFSDDRC